MIQESLPIFAKGVVRWKYFTEWPIWRLGSFWEPPREGGSRTEQLAEQLEQMALSDPDLAEHYARLAAALPALQVQRALEDVELEATPRISLVDRTWAA